MSTIIQDIERRQLREVPRFKAGDTVRVHFRVIEGSRQRIQVFDSAGHFISQWAGKQLGRPYAIAIDKHGTAYIADGGDRLYIRLRDTSGAQRIVMIQLRIDPL